MWKIYSIDTEQCEQWYKNFDNQKNEKYLLDVEIWILLKM